MLSLVVAVDEGGGIGKNGRIPWRLRADLKNFKHLTWGHHLIMGRKTFESIGRPLAGRTNIVITRQLVYQVEGCLIVRSLEEALALAHGRGEVEAFVIGGGQIFTQALPLAERIYLTQVHAVLDCDVFFPRLEEDWRIIARAEHAADEHNQYAFTYSVLERSQIEEIQPDLPD